MEQAEVERAAALERDARRLAEIERAVAELEREREGIGAGVMSALYGRVAGEAAPPGFVFVPEVVGGQQNLQSPDVCLAILQLHRWTELDVAAIAAEVSCRVEEVEGLLRDFQPGRAEGADVPVRRARTDPGGPPGSADPGQATGESLAAAISHALALGLEPEQVLQLFAIPPTQDALRLLSRARPGIVPPRSVRKKAQAFLREHARNPADARRELDGPTREALKPLFVPLIEVQAGRYAWMKGLFATYLPVPALRERGRGATVLVLGSGDGVELAFLRELLPSARLVAVDRQVTPAAVVNEVVSGAEFLHRDLYHADADRLAEELESLPAAVVARHAYAADPGVALACAAWAKKMEDSGGKFLGTAYRNCDRLLFEEALRCRGVGFRSETFIGAPRTLDELSTVNRSDRFVLAV